MPFPAGKIKVYERDSDDLLTFIGEDEIEHTPKDESIKLVIGEAFDLVCERKCLKKTNEWGIARELWQIDLKNHKSEPALMRVDAPHPDSRRSGKINPSLGTEARFGNLFRTDRAARRHRKN